jgi:aminotransferase
MGRVFDREELQGVADLCLQHDLLALTDEIYEHVLYSGEHIPLATFPGMAERTVTVSGLSKTFSVTGWRVGTIIAPADLTDAIRKVHDFLTVGAPAPLQEACAVGIDRLGPDYYASLVTEYQVRGQVLLAALQDAGFRCQAPEGAYYILADFGALSDEDDTTFAKRLAREARVASVPGSSFFSTPEQGRSLVRFAFCKKLETLEEAGRRLRQFAEDG